MIVLAVLGKSIKSVVGQNMDKFTIISPEVRKYVYSLRKYILFSTVFYLFLVILGYFFAGEHLGETEEIVSLLKDSYLPIMEMGKLSQFLFVLIKNSLTALAVVLGGFLFGIVPFLALIYNGEILGILANYTINRAGTSFFLLGIVPHGIFEIPALIISIAMGLKIGRISVKKVLRKEEVSIVKEIKIAFGVFLRIVLVLLFISAFIEILITPELL